MEKMKKYKVLDLPKFDDLMILRKCSCRDRKSNSSLFELLSIVVLFVLASDGGILLLKYLSELFYSYTPPAPQYDKYDLLHVHFVIFHQTNAVLIMPYSALNFTKLYRLD